MLTQIKLRFLFPGNNLKTMEALALLTTTSSGMKDQELQPTFSLLQVFEIFSLRNKPLELGKTTISKFKQETQQV